MRSKLLLRRTALLAACLAAAGAALAQEARGLDRAAAQVVRGTPARPLSAASNAAPAAAVAAQLRGRGEAVVASLQTTRSARSANGVAQVRMQQVVDGLVVHGAYVKAAVSARGEVLHVIDRLAPVSTPAPSRIDAPAALRAAMAHVHPAQAGGLRATGTQGATTTFDGGTFFHGAPTVTAVVLPMDDGSLARGWLVETWTRRTNQLDHVVVAGDGRVLDVERRTANDSYRIFAEDPGKNAQAVAFGPAPGGAASPNGWLGTGAQRTIEISGNNAHAYLDAKDNNGPDKGGSAVTDGNFLAIADLTASPATGSNRAVAVQNLFYLTNVVHDLLWDKGFTEEQGNFQDDNFGRGGAGRDAVQAEAQDGGGTDNANFATPADGRAPRMQMYLWTGAGSTHEVRVTAPLARSYGAMGASFGAALTTTGVAGTVATTTPADGCTAISTPLSGKVALIDRGACDFSLKVLNAQLAGASAAIIANNQATSPFTMGPGADAKRVRIGAVMISQADGTELKGLANASATLRSQAVQPLQLDGDLDADIVFHEYGHGLTWRMIGSMSGPISGAIGEGMSDLLAMLVNGDDRIGEYSASDPAGIRRAPYAAYPLSYANVNGAGVHADGEIYAAIGWRMIELFAGRNDTLFRYIVDGMNYTPAAPSYEAMRDGILQAVAVAGGNATDCPLVWQAFAQYGVGAGSSATINADGTVTTTPSNAVGSCN